MAEKEISHNAYQSTNVTCVGFDQEIKPREGHFSDDL